MTGTTAAFYVTSFDARIPRGEYRQLVRVVRSIAGGVVTGIAAVATVCLLVTAVALAAAWFVNIALSDHRQARAPIGPAAIALAPAAAPHLNFEARWARATASPQIIAVPQQPIEMANDVSSPPLPPKVVAARTTPLPRPRPLNAAQDQARPEIARSPAGQAAPQVVAAVPPPPAAAAAAEKRVTPQQAHNKAAGLPDPDSRTAVYDISARTVYLPSGEKLEAHSGLGDKLDDPRYVNVRMRGPTPPNVYDLTLREELFHGVRAIRLNPVDDGKMFGRAGMLAHTYMLGPNGQSNGCVSFKNYQAFLRAYLNGEVERLVVVPNGGTQLALAARARRGHAGRYAANDPTAEPGASTW
jgi:hypothetical protein